MDLMGDIKENRFYKILFSEECKALSTEEKKLAVKRELATDGPDFWGALKEYQAFQIWLQMERDQWAVELLKKCDAIGAEGQPANPPFNIEGADMILDKP